MKPLDIVRTPKGAYALVTETDGDETAIQFFARGPETDEKNAWWEPEDGLVVVDSIPRMLAEALAHPFGTNAKLADKHFPLPKKAQ